MSYKGLIKTFNNVFHKKNLSYKVKTNNLLLSSLSF